MSQSFYFFQIFEILSSMCKQNYHLTRHSKNKLSMQAQIVVNIEVM